MSVNGSQLELDAGWAELRLAKAKLAAERKEFEQEREESGIECKLFVGNLDPKSTAEEIKPLFDKHGTVKEFILLTDRDGKSKRSAFVKYFSRKSMDSAIAALNEKVVDKSAELPMAVREAKPKAPRPAFSSPSGGGGYNAGGYGSGAGAYGAHSSGGGAYGAAPAYNPYGGQQQSSPYPPQNQYNQQRQAYGAPPPQQSSFGAALAKQAYARGPSEANLYLNNIDRYATDMEVKQTFSQFGNVVSVKLFSAQGYGFVSFDTGASAQKAIAALNGMMSADGTKRLEVSVKKAGTGGAGRYKPY